VRRHVTVPRLIAIVGDKQDYTVKHFVGQDLDKIDSVPVRKPNAARDTFQGRMQLAEMLIALPPDQREPFQQLVYTGKLDPVTEDLDEHQLLMERENEWIRTGKGKPITTLPGDQHMEHWHCHNKVNDDPEMRGDPAVQARLKAHQDEHVARLTPGTPQFAASALLMSGQKPLAIPGQSEDGLNGQPPAQGAPADKPAGKSAAPAQDAPAGGMPKMPVVPTTGQRVQTNGAEPQGQGATQP
jgi:hypothetical protein